MMKLHFPARHIPFAATAIVLIALYIGGLCAFDNFGNLRVIVNLFGDNAFLGIAAIGATFVILTGGIDLSVGAVIAFTGILIARMLDGGCSAPGAIALALTIGAAFGVVMGGLIHFFELPPFLVTLGGMFFMRGCGFMIHKQSLGINDPFFSELVNEKLSWYIGKVEIPFVATLFLILLLAAIVFAQKTPAGRNIYALGGMRKSARLMGVPVGRTTIMVYMLAGFFSAMAGVAFAFYMQSGNPAACVGLEMDAIAAVVIGGTLLTGGVGYLGGTLLGVLVLGMIQTLINFHGELNSWWTRILVGALVLLFILLQNMITKLTKSKLKHS